MQYKNLALLNIKGGEEFLLTAYKDYFTEIIIKLSKYKCSISTTERQQLANKKSYFTCLSIAYVLPIFLNHFNLINPQI